jgi:hypothetical protein
MLWEGRNQYFARRVERKNNKSNQRLTKILPHSRRTRTTHFKMWSIVNMCSIFSGEPVTTYARQNVPFCMCVRLPGTSNCRISTAKICGLEHMLTCVAVS